MDGGAIGNLQTLRKHLNEIDEDIKSLPTELRMSAIIDNPQTTYGRIPPARLSVELPPPQDGQANDQPKWRSKSERKRGQREKEVRLLREQVAELKAALARFEKK